MSGRHPNWLEDKLSGTDMLVLREARGWEKPSDHVPILATLTCR